MYTGAQQLGGFPCEKRVAHGHQITLTLHYMTLHEERLRKMVITLLSDGLVALAPRFFAGLPISKSNSLQ